MVDRTNFPTLARPEAHRHRGSDLERGSVGTDQLATGGATRDKLAYEAWPSWTPTLANLTKGNGTVLAKWADLGGLVFYRFKFTLGSTSAIAANPGFTLPVAPHADYVGNDRLGDCIITDLGSFSVPGEVWLSSGSTTYFVIYLVSGTYASYAGVDGTVPIAVPAAGDFLFARGWYEAVS
jgi:hypothetical protein